MTSKFGKILKRVGRKWFLFLVLLIIIVFIYNQIAAVIIAIISLAIFGLSYIPSLFFNRKLKQIFKTTTFINDITIAKRIKQSLLKIQNKMYALSKKQAKKDWLILYINKQYYYCGQKALEAFIAFYKKGLGEKEILEKMQPYGITTRAEIKIIEENLIKYNRLSEREISVKEYKEKQRFN